MAGINGDCKYQFKIPIRRCSRWMDSFIHSFFKQACPEYLPWAMPMLLGEWIIYAYLLTTGAHGLRVLRCFSSFSPRILLSVPETDKEIYRRDFRLRNVPWGSK